MDQELPQFDVLDEEEMVQLRSMILREEWPQSVSCWSGTGLQNPSIGTSGITHALFLMVCLRGSMLVGGMQQGVFKTQRLRAGDACLWQPNSFTAVLERSKQNALVRMTCESDRVFVATRQSEQPLRGLVKSEFQDAFTPLLLQRILTAPQEECLHLVRTLVLECMRMTGAQGQGSQRAAMALAYIREHASMMPSRDAVAAALQMHPGHISRLCRQETGMGYMAFVHDCQMKMAAQYLRHSQLRVSEIAQLCGFSSSTWFIRLFKRHYAYTPAQWRKL